MNEFASMTEEETLLIREELLRRAAEGFEQCGNWREAAACWSDLGEHQRASALYERDNNLEQAARMLLEAKDYAGALVLYERWEQQLIEREERGKISISSWISDNALMVRILLGQAACHWLGITTQAINTLGFPSIRGNFGGQSHIIHAQSTNQIFSAEAALQAYRRARKLLAVHIHRFALWISLGDYGVLLDRYDLIQEGYERALSLLEKSTKQEEYIRIGKAYLGVARAHADRLLCQELEERLAKWGDGELNEASKPIIRPFPVGELRLLRTIEGHITGHTLGVKFLAISPDGRKLVSGSNNKTIKVWNLLTGVEEHALTSQTGGIHSLVISPDGQTLVSSSRYGTISVWNLLTGTREHTLSRWPRAAITSLVISPDGQTLVSSDWYGTISVWNLRTGTEVRTLSSGPHHEIVYLAISPDGQTLVSSSRNIIVWNLLTGAKERDFATESQIHSLAISPDGQTLISGGTRNIVVWNLLTGAKERNFATESWVHNLAISPDGQTLVSSNWYGGTITIWNLPTGTEERRLPCQRGGNSSLAISPDGQILVNGSGSSIKIWGV